MSEKSAGEGKLGFLDSIAVLFGRKQEPEAPVSQAPAGAFGKLEADFEAALRELDQKVEEARRAARPAAREAGTARAARSDDREKRLEAVYQAIREDIEAMHVQLGTGIGSAEMNALTESLTELETLSAAGRDSHELLPRARFAIANRLLRESGELAIVHLTTLLERADIGWPDPNYWPRATPEQLEQSQRRRRAGVRESFLAQGFGRIAERTLGVVASWGTDYPDRGSPLWQETVLEGVAAGIQGHLLEEFVEVLRADRELLLGRIEASIGKQVSALQEVVEKGVHSIDQATQAVATSLRALDELVPELAWDHLCTKLPQARGEFPG
jgi:hypothetical protein